MADGKSFWSLQIGGSKSAKKPARDSAETPIPVQNSQATSKQPRRSNKSTSIILGIFLIVVVAGAAVYFVVPRLSGGDSATVSSTQLASANKNHVKKGSTSTTGSTTTIPSTTTTTAIKTINLSAARVHNSYRTTGYFEFPGSWSAFSIDTSDDPLVQHGGQVIALGDLTEHYRGDQPRNAIEFCIWTFAEGKSLTPSSLMSLFEFKLWGPPTTIQATRKFVVNGYDAADKVVRLHDGTTAILGRIVTVVHGRTGCVFFMTCEEKNKSKYWPIFDQILASLNLEANATTPEEASPPSTQSF